MRTSPGSVVLAIDNPHYRDQVDGIVRACGYEALVLASADELNQHRFPRQVVILETNDDVAELMQIVYQLHASFSDAERPIVIALLSERQLRLNPRIGMWTIDGRAAVEALAIKEDWDLPAMLAQIIER